MTKQGEKIIIRLLIIAVNFLMSMRWEKHGGNFTYENKAVKEAEKYLAEQED